MSLFVNKNQRRILTFGICVFAFIASFTSESEASFQCKGSGPAKILKVYQPGEKPVSKGEIALSVQLVGRFSCYYQGREQLEIRTRLNSGITADQIKPGVQVELSLSHFDYLTGGERGFGMDQSWLVTKILSVENE